MAGSSDPPAPPIEQSGAPADVCKRLAEQGDWPVSIDVYDHASGEKKTVETQTFCKDSLNASAPVAPSTDFVPHYKYVNGQVVVEYHKVEHVTTREPDGRIVEGAIESPEVLTAEQVQALAGK